MFEKSPIYDRPCSKCGEFVVFGDARIRLGDLADHRVCVVPEHVGGSAR